MNTHQSRVAGILLLSLLLITVSFSIWETVGRRQSVPSRQTWTVAVDKLRARLQSGDKVTWYPEWAGEARLSLHGLPILLLPHHGEVDLGNAKRLWVLGAFDYDGRTLAKGNHLKPLQTMREISYERVQLEGSGEVTISLFAIEGESVQASLYNDLQDQSKIEVSRRIIKTQRFSKLSRPQEQCDLWVLNGWHCSSQRRSVKEKISKCLERPPAKQLQKRSKRRDLYTLDHRRWLPYVDCKLHPTEHVSRDWRVIDDIPRRCVSISPHKGREVELRWWPSQSHRTRSMWLSYGWEDLAVRHPFRTSKAQPLWLKVSYAHQVVFNKELSPLVGWNRVITSLEPSVLEGPPMPLVLSYQAPQGVKDATFCISLDLRL